MKVLERQQVVKAMNQLRFQLREGTQETVLV
jgi:hypothetical protein